MVGSLNQRGFTLLELMVALAITSMLLVGLYQVVDSTRRGQQILEQRQEQLHLWITLKRLLRRDLEQLVATPEESIVFTEGGLILQCRGGVVPGRSLGPRVDVRYSWESLLEGEGLVWRRDMVASVSGVTESGLNMRVDEGLLSVVFSIHDKTDWKDSGQEMEPPFRAFRWVFTWSHLGEWELIQRLF